MNRHRLPIISTIVVVAAASIMVALGFWQLGRMEEKEALLAQYEAAFASSADGAWPDGASADDSLFRRATVECRKVLAIDSVSGRSRGGAAGWAHLARCARPGGDTALVAIGWSRDPRSPVWEGGAVSGVIAPHGEGIKLVAERGHAGLEPLARPDPNDIPNNHLAYAVQWFFFAATALAIYALALRRKRRDRR